MESSRRGFLKSVMGLAVAQAFPLPVLASVTEGPFKYSHCGTTTYRMSCTVPNVQNIPQRTGEFHRIRSALLEQSDGYRWLFDQDYSVWERRLLSLGAVHE